MLIELCADVKLIGILHPSGGEWMGTQMMTEELVRSLFGQNLKRYRTRLGFSQLALALQIDMAANFLNDVEHGRKWVSPATIARLSGALGVEPFEFFLPLDMEEPGQKLALSAFADELEHAIGEAVYKTKARYSL